MSFAERHQRWLLPVLGVALAGVVWLNLPAGVPGGTGSGPASRAEAGSAPPASSAPGPAPAAAGPGGPDRSSPGPEEARPGAPELRALEAPSDPDNDALPLLVAGRQPLAPELRGGGRPPVLHPDTWTGLAQGLPPPVPAAAPVSAPAQAAAPASIDFILRSGSRQEAWVGGRGYRPGETLPGGYVLRRLTPDGAVLAGPGGERLLTLGPRGRQPAPAGQGDPP